MTKELNRNEELLRWQQRYERRNREGRSRMLDEFCEQYKYERKYAAKLLSGQLPEPSGAVRSGPESRYQPLLEVVERIWSAAEQLCGKRLAPALRLWVPHYERHHGKLLSSFRLRGLVKVRLEVLWAALTYNIQQWIWLSWRAGLAANNSKARIQVT